MYDKTVGNSSLARLLVRACICALQAFGQTPAPLAPLEQNVKTTEAAWLNLARELDNKLARMLPCDPGAAAAIQEVSTASQARLRALTAYLEAVADRAWADLTLVRNVREGEQGRLAALSAERTDTEQERAGIESQLRNIAESVRANPALGAAEQQLRQLETLVRERAVLVSRQAADGPGVVDALSKLITALERRQSALRQAATAATAEAPRWEQYYVARLARARTECAVTGGGR